MTRGNIFGNTHIGRQWRGHLIEDDCPCPQAECGLVVSNDVADDCKQHGPDAAKTIRQIHNEGVCPGRSAS